MRTDPLPELAPELAAAKPADDVGAETQSRLSWQHHCTALDSLAMLHDPTVLGVYCEVHEDYVVEHQDHFELVSCKHREPNQPPWTLQGLSDNGLAHLFSRCHAVSKATATLKTNAGVNKDIANLRTHCANLRSHQPIDPKEESRSFAQILLRSATKGKNPPLLPGISEHVDEWRRGGQVPDTLTDSATTFLRGLRIMDGLPHRDYVGSHHSAECQKILQLCGYSSVPADAFYAAVVNLVAELNRTGLREGNYHAWFTGRAPDGDLVKWAAIIAMRRIDKDALLRKMNEICLIGRRGRLEAKLKEGGVKMNRRSQATAIRRAWQTWWSANYASMPASEAVRQEIEETVLDVAAEAEDRVFVAQGGWGARMLEELGRSLDALVLPLSVPVVPTGRHLLGCALDMADRCEVWFSDEFDVDARIEAMKP